MLLGIILAFILFSPIDGLAAKGGIQSIPPREGSMVRYLVHKTPIKVPKTSFLDGKGGKVNLDGFQGKFILLNLWATWCPPCVHELPSLDRLNNLMGGEQFMVVAISQDSQGLDLIEKFFEEKEIKTLRIFNDPQGELLRSLRLFRALPISLLINPQGEILGRLNGSASWDSEEAKNLLKWYFNK